MQVAAENNPAMPGGSKPILEFSGVHKHYTSETGFLTGKALAVRAVDGVDLCLYPGETLGLVGESGCGKSTLGRLALGLERPTGGKILFNGSDVSGLTKKGRRSFRQAAQIIFQDPQESLNPRMRAGEIIEEPLKVHRVGGKEERRDRVAALLKEVGLEPHDAARFPHEFSGGQRQRINISRALALSPSVIVCDEPVSALDVSIQAQVINLLKDLKEKRGLSYLFISHDLAVVEHLSDRVAVMYLGRIVELAPARDLYKEPLHPYTQALLAAAPGLAPGEKLGLSRVWGEPPSPFHPPEGCRFHPRCPERMDVCDKKFPENVAARPGRMVECHLYG